jgi:hypothetical protein
VTAGGVDLLELVRIRLVAVEGRTLARLTERVLQSDPHEGRYPLGDPEIELFLDASQDQRVVTLNHQAAGSRCTRVQSVESARHDLLEVDVGR